MKLKNNFICGAIACAAMLASCSKDGDAEHPIGNGSISVKVLPEGDGGTKSLEAYTVAQAYETAINRIQVLVFDSAGKLERYADLDGSATTFTSSVSVGEKTVYAAVNGRDLSGIKSMAELGASALDLSDNSVQTGGGFVMSGTAGCSVTASSVAACTVSVSRIVARVALKGITNELPSSYGAVTISHVFLANVVGSQNPLGTASLDGATWYNKYGRSDDATSASQIIDGSTGREASCQSMTYARIDKAAGNGASYSPSVPHLFYTYANSSTVAPMSFRTGTFQPPRTILVAVVKINGVDNYYPVVLDKSTLERNTTYTVALTLSGPGSSDPAIPLEHGSISATISVSGWDSGVSYEEHI